MPYSSNLPQITQRLRAAQSAGLISAAAVVENQVKRELAGGYTSGNFVTGNVLFVLGHETGHALIQLQQRFQQVRADEAGHAGDQPGAGLFWELLPELGQGRHAVVIKARRINCRFSMSESDGLRKRDLIGDG